MLVRITEFLRKVKEREKDKLMLVSILFQNLGEIIEKSREKEFAHVRAGGAKENRKRRES